MCQKLMREVFWNKPPEAIEMYALKKHMQNIPEMKDKLITKMARCDYDRVKETLQTQLQDGHRPGSLTKFKNAIANDNISVI